MTLRHVLERFRALLENTINSRAEKAAAKLAKQLRWPKNPPYWLHGIGVGRDSRGGAHVVVRCSRSFASNLPKQVDGVPVVVEAS
jgi:hypothetical protein